MLSKGPPDLTRHGLCRTGLGRFAGRLGAGDPVVGDLAFEDAGDVLADRPVAAVGLDEDPLEQVIGQVDRPAPDPLGGAGVDGWGFFGATPLPRDVADSSTSFGSATAGASSPSRSMAAGELL